jgi:hypothetical protein
MINLNKKKSTSRYDPQNVHNEYGILNWLKKIGVISPDKVDEVLNGFCEANGFKDPKNKKKIRRAKVSFIQNRFDKFCRFAQDKIKADLT